MKKVLIVLFSCLFLFGCSNKNESEIKKEECTMLNKENYIIVDVRTKEEYDIDHIEGAINIPYDTIDENVDLDKEKTILVYCKSGARSNKAYQTLKNLGFDVIDLGSYENAKNKLK